MVQLEIANLKKAFVEAQMEILQYRHRDVLQEIKQLQAQVAAANQATEQAKAAEVKASRRGSRGQRPPIDHADKPL